MCQNVSQKVCQKNTFPNILQGRFNVKKFVKKKILERTISKKVMNLNF